MSAVASKKADQPHAAKDGRGRRCPRQEEKDLCAQPSATAGGGIIGTALCHEAGCLPHHIVFRRTGVLLIHTPSDHEIGLLKDPASRVFYVDDFLLTSAHPGFPPLLIFSISMDRGERPYAIHGEKKSRVTAQERKMQISITRIATQKAWRVLRTPPPGVMAVPEKYTERM